VTPGATVQPTVPSTVPSAGPSAVPPAGTVVELGPDVRVRDGGRTLVGGAPPRLLHLSERAAALVAGRRVEVGGATARQLAGQLVAAGVAHPVAASLPPVPLSEVTVVVPVRDRAAGLDRLLAALGGQVGVIVVDDASRDPGSVARVVASHQARLLALARNVGPAGARNAGLALVTTPFVAFVDSDVVVAPEAIALLLRHFAHPGVALVAPRVRGLPPAGGRVNWLSRYEDARAALDLGARPGLVRPRCAISWVPSACLLGRRDALGAGFSDGMRVAEDVDLVWRLAEAGWLVRYEPAASAGHDHRTSLRPWLARRAFYGTGAHDLARRHAGAVAPAVLNLPTAAASVALVAGRLWSPPVVAGAFGVLTARLTRVTRRTDHPVRLAAELAGYGLGSSAAQASALLLRHWWPLSLAGCLGSRRLRRTVALAAVVDGLVEYRRLRPDLDPARFVLARRLDDLAYGAGVWAGALRGRSVRALLPAFVPARRGDRAARGDQGVR
jgi:mycofactocin system glycosyltransferase